jgi:hypothetical protein
MTAVLARVLRSTGLEYPKDAVLYLPIRFKSFLKTTDKPLEIFDPLKEMDQATRQYESPT